MKTIDNQSLFIIIILIKVKEPGVILTRTLLIIFNQRRIVIGGDLFL